MRLTCRTLAFNSFSLMTAHKVGFKTEEENVSHVTKLALQYRWGFSNGHTLQ